MLRIFKNIGLALLAGAPLCSLAGDQITVNPTKLLLHGGIENANQAFQTKTGIKVAMPEDPKGCGATVLGLKTGKLNAGIMCCPPNKEEMGKEGLVASNVARDAMVFSVHESNPVDNLTSDQIRDIFQGKITNWKQLGGHDAAIQPYAFIMCPQREELGRQFVAGVRDYKNGIVGIDNSKLAASVKRIKGGPKVNQSVAGDPNGIGMSSTAYLPVKGVKFLSLDGVSATPETIMDESYPLVRYLYIVTKGYPAGSTKLYVDFLRSSEGQALLARENRLAQL